MSEPMTQRTIRVPASLWAAAQAKASKQGRTISSVIRDYLDGYARRVLYVTEAVGYADATCARCQEQIPPGRPCGTVVADGEPLVILCAGCWERASSDELLPLINSRLAELPA